jgi:hypothetical protein
VAPQNPLGELRPPVAPSISSRTMSPWPAWRVVAQARAWQCGGVPQSTEPLLTVPWGGISVRYGKERGTFGRLEVFPDHAEVTTGAGPFERKGVLHSGAVDAYRATWRVLVIRFPETDIRLNIHARLFHRVALALHDAGFELRLDQRGA